METKKPTSPWIILGLGVAALIILYLLPSDNLQKGIGEESTVEVVSIAENNNTVTDFVNFVTADKQQMGLNHAYTSQALLKLVKATSAMAIEIDYHADPDLDKVNDYAQKITDDPYADTHADNIRNAADILTNVLANMQKTKYPGLTSEVAALKDASASINPDVLTLHQKEAIKSFLRTAADLLKKMN
ncbi:MAG: hypothetical protein WKF97_02945 [Chitinophagaceae bacterium]